MYRMYGPFHHKVDNEELHRLLTLIDPHAKGFHRAYTNREDRWLYRLDP